MDNIQVYLLTCQPHDEVYSLYGHTAIRLKDDNRGIDVAINWGVFDPTVDFFPLRFIFGLTDYMMGIVNIQDFLNEYNYYGSGVYQQHINLTSREKQQFIEQISINAQPENVVYRYNFYYDNCTTRARDVIENSINGTVDYNINAQKSDKVSFRKLIHEKNEQHPWARFGNDILLGVGSDKNATIDEQEFIPDVLQGHYSNAIITRNNENSIPLVDEEGWILKPGTPWHPDTKSFPLTPTQCALIYLCVILALLVYQRITKKDRPWLEYIILLPYGITGIILFAMLFSKHPTVNVNLQIFISNIFMLYFTFPKTRFKYRWHTVMALCTLFFLGNAIQSYAEGINIMALALSIVSIRHISRKN
ncbi:MAG: DUF4105 domain-containing protein [Prevotella sp.]|nr:DUF4105 domain-containing protein [Candidatus Prevotella equi]